VYEHYSFESGPIGRHDERRKARHFRFVAGHRLRMVRLLHLRHARGVPGEILLLQRGRQHRLHLHAVGVCRGLCGAPVRRPDLRPARRHDRPQIHLPDHHEPDGRRHVLHRRAARLRDVGHPRPDRAGLFAAGARARARRRIWRRRGTPRPRTLARGGEYGGAAIYVAEHAPANKRGYYTSWIQTTATLGLFMAILLILGIRTWMGEAAFGDWGWRIPFLLSAILLAVSIWIRLKLNESPLFRRMVEE